MDKQKDLVLSQSLTEVKNEWIYASTPPRCPHIVCKTNLPLPLSLSVLLSLPSLSFNILQPTGNFRYHKVEYSKILHCGNLEFVCFVWISEQTANFDLRNAKRLFFLTEVASVYCAVRTESLYNTDMFRL